MAYISTADVAKIRQALKVEFPKCRFSVSKGSGSLSVNVSVMKSHIDFGVDNKQVNHYWIADHYNKEQAAFLNKVHEIICTAPENKWFDKSDSMIDYFHTAFYIHMEIGKYNKPYEKI